MDQKKPLVKPCFEEATSFKRLHLAFRKAYRSARHSEGAQRFFFNLERELFSLQDALRSGLYRPGRFFSFTVRKPKERLISVAPFRDRVVHHALVQSLEPLFERVFIYDSYATRKNKGVHLAISHAQQMLRSNAWYLKMDIRKYFDSIDHDILLERVKKKIQDQCIVNWIQKMVCLEGFTGKGLPIGNLTSQFFANVYLDPFDHWIKDQLGIKYYIRYMDDFVIFSHDPSFLKILQGRIISYLEDTLKLKVKESTTTLQKATHGLSFLGVRVFPGLIRVQSDSLKRSLSRLKRRKIQWENGRLSEQQFLQSYASIMGHLSQMRTLQLRKKVFG